MDFGCLQYWVYKFSLWQTLISDFPKLFAVPKPSNMTNPQDEFWQQSWKVKKLNIALLNQVSKFSPKLPCISDIHLFPVWDWSKQFLICRHILLKWKYNFYNSKNQTYECIYNVDTQRSKFMIDGWNTFPNKFNNVFQNTILNQYNIGI